MTDLLRWKRAQRRSRVNRQPYVTAIATAAVVAGVVQLTLGEYSPAMLTLHGTVVTVLWCLYLVVGGTLTLVGVVTHRPGVEGVGLIVLATAQAVLGFSTIVALGWAYSVSGAVHLGLALAHLSRAAYLRQSHVPGVRP